jgi:hypothetical protein
MKEKLVGWVEQALKANGGEGTIVEVARHIRKNHEAELKAAGDLFYTWQYDMRWAANRLKREKRLVIEPRAHNNLWRLA